ncbi:hypothetical protein [Rhizobium sp. Leaf311]|uniref:hypothetical protein n=1 Tax=Rhizobium sp. Leaf311 TaxID=1736332 RepID=UPI000AFCBB37|nr:hypothetical protein [Rhizobium sp. Leaf311]
MARRNSFYILYKGHAATPSDAVGDFMKRRMKECILRKTPTLFEILKYHRETAFVLAASFVALFIAGIASTLVIPELRPGGLGALRNGGESGSLGWLISSAYSEGNIPYAMAVTFLVNLMWAGFLQTTLPTFVVPYLGVVVTGLRFLLWGILFTLVGANDQSIFIHYITLFLEGFAYALAALAAWIHSRMFLRPGLYGLRSRIQGYKAGLVATAKIYIIIIPALIMAAAYEAISVIGFIAQ